MNRRRFLSTGAAGISAAAHALPFAADKPRRVGLIGCGWYGKCDLFRLIQVAPVEVVSLCDVDKRMLERAADLVAGRQKSRKKPRTYSDYRELLKQKDVDIVLIATPDHWHALPMIAAVQSGADVYVQKPISVDIAEGQAMLAAARKYKRVVQVGTQRRSTPHLIEARENIIKPGKLGKVALVEIYCYYHMRARGNPPDTAPPDYLDYEMWTGPAPMRPYNELVHPGRWRAFMEYGNGIVGDMCIHMLDMVRWMLDLGWPVSFFRRHPHRQKQQGQHLRHAGGDLRFRRPESRLATPHLGYGAGSTVPLGRDALWRQRNTQSKRDELRLHAGREGRSGHSPRCEIRA